MTKKRRKRQVSFNPNVKVIHFSVSKIQNIERKKKFYKTLTIRTYKKKLSR